MVEIIVSPETFEKVFFKHPEVVETVQDAIDLVPGASELGTIKINIDEDLPTNRVRMSSVDPATFEVNSGAMEDTTTPRTFSPLQTKINVGRLLYEALDRANPKFGAPAIDAEIPQQVRGAWDIYSFGRVSRLGLRMHKPRYIYNFHNWVGFSDAAAERFEELWAGSELSFADLEAAVAGLTPTRTI